MRDVEYEHEFILEEAKVLPQREGGTWVEDQYDYHPYIRERDYSKDDRYTGEDTNTDVSETLDVHPDVDMEHPRWDDPYPEPDDRPE